MKKYVWKICLKFCLLKNSEFFTFLRNAWAAYLNISTHVIRFLFRFGAVKLIPRSLTLLILRPKLFSGYGNLLSITHEKCLNFTFYVCEQNKIHKTNIWKWFSRLTFMFWDLKRNLRLSFIFDRLGGMRWITISAVFLCQLKKSQNDK